MRDLIERQEAIDAPEEFIKDCNPEHFVGHQKFIEFMDDAEIGSFGNWQFANGFNMGLTAAEVAINELPSSPRWVPVSERLPEVDIPVLVTDDAGGWATIEVDKCGVYDESDERFWYTSQNVTAWMPLPEPYDGGDHETH